MTIFPLLHCRPKGLITQTAPQNQIIKGGHAHPLVPNFHLTQPLYTQLLSHSPLPSTQFLSRSTPVTMAIANSIATFRKFNENASKCSAWLEEKDRCCGRNIVAADQERRTLLLESIPRNRIYDGDNAKELAGLYFCNGWHRPGGIYAVSSSEAGKLLQTLSSRAPESGPQFLRAVRPQEPPISSPTNETQGSVLQHLSNRETSSFSVAQSALQRSRHNTSELSEAERLSFSIAQSAVRDSRHKAAELSEVERLSLSIALLAVQPLEYEMTTSSSDSAVQRTARTESDQPGPSSLSCPAESDRKDRPVDVAEGCPICLLALEDPTEVTRCKFCYGDIHTNCAAEWLTTPDSATKCTLW